MPVEDLILPAVILGSLFYLSQASASLPTVGTGTSASAGAETGTEAEDTGGTSTGGTGGTGGSGTDATKPKPLPPGSNVPPWATTLFAVNDVAKELIGDVVTAKIISSLLNESGQRKMLV
jgi:hypothetical protein